MASKYRGLVYLLSALVIAVVLLWGGRLSPLQLVSRATLPSLSVDVERLRSHLTTLSIERYLDTDLANARDYLTDTLTAYGYEPEPQPFGSDTDSGINLIATRPGSAPETGTLLVGAHYDTVQYSPGADDNASAIAATLEIARLFADYPTPRTLKIVFFDQEERQSDGLGLLGSRAFVETEENLVGLQGAIILEMLGYVCEEVGCQQYPPGLPISDLPEQGNFLGAIGDFPHPELLQAFRTVNTPELPIITLPVPVGDIEALPDLFRSDHVPFWQAGLGAVMVTDTADFRNPHYHLPTDTPETLDEAFLCRGTQKIIDAISALLT
ncbi:MAG: M20/M25/M40 family metallo-hydrolase [Cyanobacteria bacterium P01_F01_bin.4]